MIFAWPLMFYSCMKVLICGMLLVNGCSLSSWFTVNKCGMYTFIQPGSLKNVIKLFKYQSTKSKYFMIKIAVSQVKKRLAYSFLRALMCKVYKPIARKGLESTDGSFRLFRVLSYLIITWFWKLFLYWILPKISVFVNLLW